MKTFVRLTMAMALLVPMGVITAAPASAAPLLTCSPPSGKLAISPGLGKVAKIQTTIINLPFKNCKGTKGITSGVSKGTSKGTKATTCADFFKNPANTAISATTTWSNKKTSTFVGKSKITVQKGALVVIITGKITKGTQFVGKTLSTTVKVTLIGSCAKPPLKTILITGTKPLVIS